MTNPKGDMSAATVWDAWNKDRWAYSVCDSRHKGLTDWAEERSILD